MIYIFRQHQKKKRSLQKIIKKNQKNQLHKYGIKIYENKGRNLYPFIKQMRNYYKEYKYICHLHIKRSSHK